MRMPWPPGRHIAGNEPVRRNRRHLFAPRSNGRFMPLVALLLLFALGRVATAHAEESRQVLTPEQREAVEQVIREYLLEHPEVLDEAIAELGRRHASRRVEETRQTIALRREELYNDPEALSAGAANADLTIVEFFDYNCPYCRMIRRALFQLLDEDTGVRLVFKEFPILSPESVVAARAALASRHQGKYVEFHNALFETKGRLTEEKVFSVAERVELDTERLRRDMISPQIDSIIQRNIRLARDLNVRGTPALVIGDEMIPGAVDLKGLKDLVARARQG